MLAAFRQRKQLKHVCLATPCLCRWRDAHSALFPCHLLQDLCLQELAHSLVGSAGRTLTGHITSSMPRSLQVDTTHEVKQSQYKTMIRLHHKLNLHTHFPQSYSQNTFPSILIHHKLLTIPSYRYVVHIIVSTQFDLLAGHQLIHLKHAQLASC